MELLGRLLLLLFWLFFFIFLCVDIANVRPKWRKAYYLLCLLTLLISIATFIVMSMGLIIVIRSFLINGLSNGHDTIMSMVVVMTTLVSLGFVIYSFKHVMAKTRYLKANREK